MEIHSVGCVLVNCGARLESSDLSFDVCLGWVKWLYANARGSHKVEGTDDNEWIDCTGANLITASMGTCGEVILRCLTRAGPSIQRAHSCQINVKSAAD
eukprot:3171311-Amphidinium_carterae.1